MTGNQMLSLFFPIRPLVQVPMPDGSAIVDSADRYMLCGLYPMTLENPESSVNFYINQNVTPIARIIIEDLLNAAYSIDVTNWVIDLGRIRRSISYDTGKMSMSSHGFKLRNPQNVADRVLVDGTSDAAGGDLNTVVMTGADLTQVEVGDIYYDLTNSEQAVISALATDTIELNANLSNAQNSISYKIVSAREESLFSAGALLGTGFWQNKEYNVWLGFYDDSGIENLVNIYTGKIFSKQEDRIGKTVLISSNDIIKELNDYKVATVISASSVFDYYDTTTFLIDTTLTDNRSIQQVVKHGTHKLVSSLGDSQQKTNRKDPFDLTLGTLNISDATWKNAILGTIFAQGYLWYFPFQNRVNTNDNNEYTNGTLKIYYWDYRKDHRIWRAFDGAELNTQYFIIDKQSAFNGIFLEFLNPSMNISGDTSHFPDYINKVGTWALAAADLDSYDPCIAVESISKQVKPDNLGDTFSESDANPVRVIFDLMAYDRFANYDVSVMDVQLFDTPDPVNFTWDKAYAFLDNEAALINTSIEKETSLMAVIDEICEISGLQFFASRKKTGNDQRIKIIDNSPINPAQYPLVENLLLYSTLDRLSKFEVKTDTNYLKNIVSASSLVISATGSFNVAINEISHPSDIDRLLQLGSTGKSNVYLYNSLAFANVLGQRYLNQFENPIEIYDVDFGKAGFGLELGELVQLHDHMTNKIVTAQIFEEEIEVKTAKKGCTLKRFPFQFGPDEDYPCKLWGFTDFAYTTNDECPEGGVGGHSYYCY